MTNDYGSKEVPIYLTPKRLADEMDLPMGGLRHWLFYRETNGLAAAVFQIGRKLLIEKQAFLAWVSSHKCHQGGC